MSFGDVMILNGVNEVTVQKPLFRGLSINEASETRLPTEQASDENLSAKSKILGMTQVFGSNPQPTENGPETLADPGYPIPPLLVNRDGFTARAPISISH